MRNKLGCGCLSISLAIVLLGSLAVFYIFVVSYPKQATSLYGEPSNQLSFFQRMTITMELVNAKQSLLTPMAEINQEQEFVLAQGQSIGDFAVELESAGVISNSQAFTNYLIYKGWDTSIQAGSYIVDASQSPMQIAENIHNLLSTQITFTIFPGWRVEEVYSAIKTAGFNFSESEFLELMNHPESLALPVKLLDIHNLEGYLFPGEYHFQRGTSLQTIIESILQRFDQSITTDISDTFANKGFSLEQAVTLASIIQREAFISNEMPIIASVFENRIKSDMKLESDPTVQYAMGFNANDQSWWKTQLTLQDLAVESPYNTYTHSGLPPGPIDSPGLDAIKSVAYSAQTPYYYFRAKCDGTRTHYFSVTYEEHLQHACP